MCNKGVHLLVITILVLYTSFVHKCSCTKGEKWYNPNKKDHRRDYMVSTEIQPIWSMSSGT